MTKKPDVIDPVKSPEVAALQGMSYDQETPERKPLDYWVYIIYSLLATYIVQFLNSQEYLIFMASALWCPL